MNPMANPSEQTQTARPPPTPPTTELFELNAAAEHSRRASRKKKNAKRKAAREIKSGSSIVRVSGPDDRDQYTASYRDRAGGPRLRKMFADYGKAVQFAEDKALELANGESWRRHLTQADVACYQRCRELAHQVNTAPELLMAEIVEARQRLQARFGAAAPSLITVVQEHIDRQPAAGTTKTGPEILEEMLAARKRDGAFKNTLDDYRSRLGRFTRHFTGPLHTLAANDINAWLRGLHQVKRKGEELITLPDLIRRRTRNNFRGNILDFYRFAEECSYVPKGHTRALFGDVPRVKDEPIVVRIFPPEDMLKILTAALPNLVPFLAIGAFATVRSEEMVPDDPNLPRLDWREIDFENAEIRILPEVARKIGEDRIIPMPANLIAWLRPHAKPNGPVCELANVSNALARTAEKAKVEWIRNGLRKSSISYRLAIVKSKEQVAEEAGTSPERIRLNYKKTPPEREAKRWYTIKPESAQMLLFPGHAATAGR